MLKIKNATWFTLVQSKIDEIYNRYELKEGNIIKLGNVYLKLKKLCTKNKRNKINFNRSFQKLNRDNIDGVNNTSIILRNEINKGKTSKKYLEINNREINDLSLTKERKKNDLNLTKNLLETKKEVICKICYNSDTEEDNPLINPCSCHGSMKYIHFKCLKYWLEENSFVLEEKYEYFLKYKYKELKCELCKSEYPDIIHHKGKDYDFFDINDKFNLFKKYVIFEKLSNEDDKYKTLYMLSLDKNNKLLKIGRAKDNELCIPEASISRNHCGLFFQNNILLLEDTNSKFGTLILIQTPFIKLTEYINLYLQIGNNYIKCKVNNLSKNSIFSCCYIDNQENNYDFYYKQNIIKSQDNNIDNKDKLNIGKEIDNEKENLDKINVLFTNKKIKNERPKNKQTSNMMTNVEDNKLIDNIQIFPEQEDKK